MMAFSEISGFQQIIMTHSNWSLLTNTSDGVRQHQCFLPCVRVDVIQIQIFPIDYSDKRGVCKTVRRTAHALNKVNY